MRINSSRILLQEPNDSISQQAEKNKGAAQPDE